VRKLIVIFLLSFCSSAKSQIPVELYFGHNKTTMDIMFFKYFKNTEGVHSKWLFFNRNRVGIDYRMTESEFLPQFGFTEAISYNHKKLKGFAPVFVVQVLEHGIFPKAGIQYVFLKKGFTLFSWSIVETAKKPDIDYFLLIRFIPELSEQTKLFMQLESVNNIPTNSVHSYNFTQRIRLGFQWINFQFGMGLDFNQNGKKAFTKSNNPGIFVRHEF
jgi:hypothetical protein